MFLSGYWLSYGFDWTTFGWFVIGIIITVAEEILGHCLFIWRKNGK